MNEPWTIERLQAEVVLKRVHCERIGNLAFLTRREGVPNIGYYTPRTDRGRFGGVQYTAEAFCAYLNKHCGIRRAILDYDER